MREHNRNTWYHELGNVILILSAVVAASARISTHPLIPSPVSTGLKTTVSIRQVIGSWRGAKIRTLGEVFKLENAEPLFRTIIYQYFEAVLKDRGGWVLWFHFSPIPWDQLTRALSFWKRQDPPSPLASYQIGGWSDSVTSQGGLR